ncbi:MAG: molybdopterin-dependent oxidoreductase [Chloroflexi bacterium]|nr:molybdopterin-dependent oxidoreductase [Chloroflexota bacterium]
MRRSLLLLLSACVLILGLAGCGAQGSDETVLELVHDDTVIELSLRDLQKMPSAEGLAGIMSSTGKITAPVVHKGVLLTTLLDELGGLDESSSVQVQASDGYAMTLSANQITSGQFATYDVATGDEVEPEGPLQVLIAYERDGELMNKEQEGTLRMVVIGSSPLQVVDGHWSVKWTNRIELKEALEDWTVDFVGAISAPMDRGTFESGAAEGCHQENWTDEEGRVWSGIPLFYLLGRVDDEIKHGDDAYRDDLARAGYTIEVTAKDGYSVTLDSALVTRNDNIFLAYLVDGQALEGDAFPLRLVGSEIDASQMIGGITKVVIHFPGDETDAGDAAQSEAGAASAEPAVVGPQAAALTIRTATGDEVILSMSDLSDLAVVNTSVEHPSKGPMDVTGVPVAQVLAAADAQSEGQIVVFTASDGYSVEIPMPDVLACEECLVGWDEEMLRSYMPGFEGGMWVKDLASIEVE